MQRTIHDWLNRFELDAFIRERIVEVMGRLPDIVRDDFLQDVGFQIYDFEPGPDVVMQVPVCLSTTDGSTAARCVVLKRTLRHRPIAFARYIVAHELAHAHLRNEGRHPDEDPEHAADALAAEWGFPRTSYW